MRKRQKILYVQAENRCGAHDTLCMVCAAYVHRCAAYLGLASAHELLRPAIHVRSGCLAMMVHRKGPAGARRNARRVLEAFRTVPAQVPCL